MLTDYNIPKTLREIITSYGQVGEECLCELENSVRLVPVKKRDAIVCQGEVCDDIVFNRVGLFRVSNVSDGVEDTLLFGSSGDVFTSLHSYFAKEPSIFSLVAVEPSEVWLLSYSEFNRISDKYPEMVRWFRDLLIGQLYCFEKRYLFFNNKSAEDRFLNFLRLNCDTLRCTSVKYITRIMPLKYIAQYLKISPFTLSRLRRKLVLGSLPNKIPTHPDD